MKLKNRRLLRVLPPLALPKSSSSAPHNGVQRKLLFEAEEEGSLIVSEDNTEFVSSSDSLWDTVPQRYKLILTTAFAFVICNMDKVWSCYFFFSQVKQDAQYAVFGRK